MIQKQDGKAILTDFGLAKSLETTKFTATGKIMGSPHYLAPELAKGELVSKSTDLYSLGITMFEMATGKVPFEGETAVQIVLKHIREDVPKPSKVKPDILPELEKIIIKATKKNPSSRYQNAKELINDLKRLKKKESPTVEIQRRKKGKKSSLFLIFFVLLIISAGSYYFINYYGKRDSKKTADKSKINKVLKKENKKTVDNKSKEIIKEKKEKPSIIKTEKTMENKKEEAGNNKESEDSKNTIIQKMISEKSYSVIITSNAKTDVIIDNKLIGTIPPKKIVKLKKGKHKIIFMKGEGNNIKTIVKDIIIKDSGKPVIINQVFELYAHIKMINAFPWANVYLDKINKSDFLGLTPKKGM
jgi:serine/threonine protein kinase